MTRGFCKHFFRWYTPIMGYSLIMNFKCKNGLWTTQSYFTKIKVETLDDLFENHKSVQVTSVSGIH